MSSPFEVALKHFNLYKPEASYKILCPFHKDVNASMLINVEQSYFHCFGCGASGGAQELVQKFNPEDSPLDCLFELSRITKGKIINNNKVKENLTKASGIVQAKDYYFNLPRTNWFKVLDVDDLDTKKYLKDRGFKTKFLNDINCKINYNTSYPIIFPIYDNNIFKGWVCRTTNLDIEKERKYLYNKGFKRRTTLGGIYTKGEPVLLVEGYIDMLMARQSGIKNVVSILGWKITEQQLKKLYKKEIPLIISGLDNDVCGEKGYKFLKQTNIKIVKLNYGKNKDFGDVVKNNDIKKITKQIERWIY